jgi:outer membrane protein assembly factor BamB
VVTLGALSLFVLRDEGVAVSSARVDATGRLVVDAGDGPSNEPEERWAENLDCEYNCALATVGRNLVVAEAGDRRSELRAFEGRSGDELWSSRTASGDIVTHMVVWNGLLLALGGSGPDVAVSAWDPGSGERLWAEGFSGTLLFGDDVIVLSEWDTRVESQVTRALTARDGDELWELDGSPVGLCGETAVIRDDRHLVAVAIGSGEQRWSASVGAGSPSTCSSGAVHVIDDRDVISFDLGSGEERWSQRVREASSLRAAGDVLVVYTDRDVIGYGLASGEELWSVDGDDWDPFQLNDIGGNRALGIGGGRASVIDLATGDTASSIRIDDFAPQAIGSTTLHLLDRGEVSSYVLRDLERRWRMKVPDDAVAVTASTDAVFVLFPDEVIAYG